MRNPALKRFDTSLDQYRQIVRDAMSPHRLELIHRQAAWIKRTEKWVASEFIKGSDVDVSAIQPALQLAVTERDHAVWRYCRLMGSIPYNRSCGRLLRYILRDVGQQGSPVMGVIALASPVLISRPRDQWIGWSYPDDADLKRRRLLTCMDLTVSMAVPPYNFLTAGKMICLAALSNQVREDYCSKFGNAETPTGLKEGRLALITTTSLYGSSIQYNRLRLDGRTAYQFVGYTSGFGNTHLTEEEFRQMEKYLHDIGKPIPKGWGTGRSYRLRVYTAYCRNRFGQKNAPAHEHARSVYVAPLASNTHSFLRGETDDLLSFDLPIAHLSAVWKRQWLARRIANPSVMSDFRSADPRTRYLSAELEVQAT